jgi:hypothetical protein
VKSGAGGKPGEQSWTTNVQAPEAAEVEKTREVQFENRFGYANESDVAAELEVVVTGDEVQVVGEFVARFRALHW